MANLVLLECKRQATRRGVLIGAAAYLALCASALLYLGPHLVYEAYLWIAYLILPMLAAPFGAALGSRDRDLGFSPVLAALPMRRSLRITAHLLFLVLLFALLGLLALPLAWLSLAGYSAAALSRGLEYATWGFVLATLMAFLGYAIGEGLHLRAVVAATASLLVSIVAFAMGAGESPAFGMLAETIGTGPALFFLHLSPVTWAMDDLSLSMPRPFAPAVAMMGAGTAAATLVCLILIAGFLTQRSFRSSRRSWGRVGMIAASVIALALLANLALADYSVPPTGTETRQFKQTSHGLTAWASIYHDDPTNPYLSLQSDSYVRLALAFKGPRNGSVEVSNLRVGSDSSHFQALDPMPSSIQLGMVGFRSVEVRYQITPFALRQSVELASVSFDANGDHYSVDVSTPRSPQPVPGVAVSEPVAALAAVGFFGVAVVLPRRLNAW